MEKSAENRKIPQKFGISRQILDKMRVRQCENLHCLKAFIFFSFHEKNLVCFLSYVILKFSLDFPMKIVR